jgi:MFS family permease
MITSLRANLDQVQWILTGAGIAQTVVMPMVGWLTTLIGHRNLYLGSLTLFCGGSVLSGLAWSIKSLMASGIFSLVQSMSGTIGTAISATFYEQRYACYVQHYANNNDLAAFGIQEALTAVLLQGAGEISAWLAMQTEAVVHGRLLAEATIAAYQDYFFLVALVVVLSILPALPWVACLHSFRAARRSKSAWEALPAVPLPTEAAILTLGSPGRGLSTPVP